MDAEVIDDNILLIARNLECDVSDERIITAFIEAGFSQENTFLLLEAAKILHRDRITAPKLKGVFRRSEQ